MEITRAGSQASTKGSSDYFTGDVVWFSPGEWADEVYRPDIVDKAATLYKKPGYTM